MGITTKEVKKGTVTKEETKASGTTKKKETVVQDKELSINLIEVGDRVRELREAKKLSKTKLADIVGVSRQFIGNIENGDSDLCCDTLMKIAKALDTSDMYLLHGTEIEKIEYSCKILQLLKGRTAKEVNLAYMILKVVLDCFKMLVPVTKTE